MTVLEDRMLSRALRPLSWVYGAVVHARNRSYDRPGAARRAPLPVVSVGNLTLGGTGKTPLVAWIATRVLAEGRLPAVVSRGYGGGAGRGPLLVSRGNGPTCDARACGDEPYLLARTLDRTVVVVGADRWAGVAEARRAGADVAILDDGFQHRRLARDLDIVLLDARRPFGNGALLPAGALREPVGSIERADVVVLTRCDVEPEPAELARIVAHLRPGVPLLRALHRRTGFVDGAGRACPTPRRAVAFCGIAGSEAFRADVAAEGVTALEFHGFRDHHVYSARELGRLAGSARRHGVPLVTTEKDLARLGPDAARLGAVVALRIEAVLREPEPLVAALRRLLQRSAA